MKKAWPSRGHSIKDWGKNDFPASREIIKGGGDRDIGHMGSVIRPPTVEKILEVIELGGFGVIVIDIGKTKEANFTVARG